MDSDVKTGYDLPPADPRSLTSENIWNDISGWEFFSIVIDKAQGEIHIYRAGQEVDFREGLTIGTADPSPNFFVGTTGDFDLLAHDVSSYFKGSLDDLRVYNRTLSPEEVQELYALAA